MAKDSATLAKAAVVPWDSVQKERLNPLVDRQFISTSGVTLARFNLKKGALVPEHQHENEQLSYVVNGALHFVMPGNEVTVRGGEVLCIPPHLPHSAEAKEDCYVIDVFIPNRKDWEAKDDAYLRGK